MRLVECWQISQPLYLRHLSIVRDTVLRGKTNVYIYYTFENFRRLVENKTAFWEAVTTVPDGVTNGINVAASLDATPKLDEHGFPVLDFNPFHGQDNSATLEECVSALHAEPFRLAIHDPVLKKQINGSYGTMTELSAVLCAHGLLDLKRKTAQNPPPTPIINRHSDDAANFQSKPSSMEPRSDQQTRASGPSHAPVTQQSAPDVSSFKPRRPRSLLVKQKGRPRKYPKAGASTESGNTDPHGSKRLKDSQEMAEKYARSKIENEISWRIDEGADAVFATHEVLAEVETSRQEEGQEPLSVYSKAMILHAFAGGPEPEARNVYKRPRGRRKRASYWPSMAAHTLFVPDSLKSSSMGIQQMSKRANDVTISEARKRRLPARLRDSENEEKPLPTKKQHRNRAVAVNQTTDLPYLPSVAAHSARCLSPFPVLEETVKRRPGRPRKQKNPACTSWEHKRRAEPRFRYSPSFAAHSGVFLSAFSQASVTPVQKKRALQTFTQSSGITSVANDTGEPEVCYPPSTDAHSPLLPPPFSPSRVQEGRQDGASEQSLGHLVISSSTTIPPGDMSMSRSQPAQEASQATPYSASSVNSEGLYPGWVKFMAKYYDPELRDIGRPCDGIFIGETKPRRKRNNEPAGFRPRYFKIIIIKCTRLHGFDWFTGKTEPPKRAHPHYIQQQSLDQSLTQPLSQPGSIQATVTQSAGTSSEPWTPVAPSAGQPPLNDQSDQESQSSCVTPYSTTNRRKRRRNESDDSGRKRPRLSPSNTSLRKQQSTIASPDVVGAVRVPSPVEKAPLADVHSLNMGVQDVLAPGTESLGVCVRETHVPNVQSTDIIVERSAAFLNITPHIIEQASHEVGEGLPLIEETPNRVLCDQTSIAEAAQLSSVSEQVIAEGTQTPAEVARSPVPSIFDPSSTADESQVNGIHGYSTQTPIVSSTSKLHGNAIEEASVQTLTNLAVSTTEDKGEKNNDAGVSRPSASSPLQLEEIADRGSQAKDSARPQVSISNSSKAVHEEDTPTTGQKSFARMTRRGGSVAIIRKDIVMNIMEKCEGVFAGYKEMSRPFAVEWTKRGLEGTPEDKTILNAVTSLRSEGKLREIRFTFQSKQGFNVNKSMLMLPNIDITDPRVKDVQTKMMAHFPRHYLPKALMSLEESSNNHGERSDFARDGKPVINPKIMDGKYKAAEATLAAIKAQELTQLERNGQQETSTQDGWDHEVAPRSIDVLPSPIRRVPIIRHLPPSHLRRSTAVKRPRGGRVERLASVLKPSKPSLPLSIRGQASTSSNLTWLPAEYAFSEVNYEEERPTVLEPTIRQDTRRLYTRYGDQLKSLKHARRDVPSDFAESTLQTASLQVGNAISTIGPTAIALEQLGDLSYRSPYTADLDRSKAALPLEDVRHSQPVKKRRRILLAPDKVSGEVLGSCQRTPTPTIDHSTADVSLEQTYDVQPRQKELVVNFMDAIHYFHQTTGTFFVGFSGLGPLHQINKRVGTCSKPYSLGPRNYHSEFPAPRGPRYVLPRRPPDAEDTQFEKEVDALLDWECETAGLQDIEYEGLPFVNHTFHHVHTTSEAVDAKMNSMKEVLVSAKKGRFYNRRLPTLKAVRPKISKSIFNSGTKDISSAAAAALKRIAVPAPLKERRLTSLVKNTHYEATSGSAPLEDTNKGMKFRNLRGPRDAKSLGHGGEKRLLTAVMVVRTLTGGLEKRIDWVLVAKAFGSNNTQMFINGRWNYVLQRHKLILPKMESDFQELFAEAYQEGLIPTLDFENLVEYDWKWLIDWTMNRLGTRSKSQPDLLGDRAKFDKLYELKDSSEIDLNDYYGINGLAQTVASRGSIINSKAYVHPVNQKHQRPRSYIQDQHDVAKTWIRANIVTPEDTYNPNVARAKLGTIPIQVVEDTLKQLLLDKVLSQENKGRLIPGRNYDISEQFLARMKKNLLPEHFQRAAAYKLNLDQKFEEEGFVPYSLTAADGDVLAIINLLSHQRLKLVPVNVPMDKWGHTDGSYESRHMDKSRLDFQMHIQPSPTYVAGNPLLPLPEPPWQHLEDPAAKIPLWYDIHGSLVPVMWDMALAAVMAVLAVRPGVDEEEIEKAMKPAMEAWELESVLQWMVEAKAAVRVGSGYAVDEWWWLALGGRGVIDKGKGKEKVVDEISDHAVMDISDEV